MNRRYIGAVAVTPSDSTVLGPTAGIYVGGTGDLKVKFYDGSEVTLTAVPAGTWFDGFCVIKVMAATDATNVLALY